jgi:hypothetical protein
MPTPSRSEKTDSEKKYAFHLSLIRLLYGLRNYIVSLDIRSILLWIHFGDWESLFSTDFLSDCRQMPL